MSHSPILCVLAGGRSSRFAGSKLEIRINGQPLLGWLRRQLAGVCAGRCWLNVAPGRPLPTGSGGFERIVHDRGSFPGPLAGIAALLDAARPCDRLVIVAADMPLVEPSYIQLLLRRLASRRGTAAVMGRWTCGSDRGQIEPLPSVWRAGAGGRLVRRALAAGLRGPQRLASWNGVCCVPIPNSPGSSQWINLNRREDLDRLPPGWQVTAPGPTPQRIRTNVQATEVIVQSTPLVLGT